MNDEKQIDDGGPAFPEGASGPYANGEIVPGLPGMTLRDYFAGQALNGHLSDGAYRLADAEDIAKWSYQCADAMLPARKREATNG